MSLVILDGPLECAIKYERVVMMDEFARTAWWYKQGGARPREGVS